MLSKMLAEAVEAITNEDMEQEELEVFLEFVFDENPDLVDLVEGGWILDEALDHLDSLMELKVPSPKQVAAMKGKKKVKVPKPKGGGRKANLQKGNPNNNPWSDYGAKGVKGAAGTGGTTMHNVIGGGGRSRTGEWSCQCQNYECSCTSVKRKTREGKPYVKNFTIDGEKHKAYNRKYKAHPHPRKDHPNSV